MTNFTYRITLYRDNSQYTAYQGTSRLSAQKAVDMLRATLILSNGTADIFAYSWGKTFPLYRVADGAAQLLGQLDGK